MVFLTKSRIPCYHEEESIKIIEYVVRFFNPELVIELGTKYAGFTMFLQEFTNDDVEIHTYDATYWGRVEIFRDNVYFYLEDILNKQQDGIHKLCKSKKRKLLYCDNGDKVKEVIAYAPSLNSGDLLGMHDWGIEISYVDVKEVLTEFKPYMNHYFERKGLSTRFWIRG